MLDRIEKQNSANESTPSIKQTRDRLYPILRDDPHNAKAWFQLADTCDYENYIECLEKVIELNPDHQSALEQLRKVKTDPVYIPNDQVANLPLEGKFVYKSNAFRVLFLRYFKYHVVFWLVIVTSVESMMHGLSLYGYIAGFVYLLIVFLFVLYCRSELWQIELDANFLTGPMKIGSKWERVKVPVHQINVRCSDQKSNIFGFYTLRTMSGREIRITAFRHNFLLSILSFIRARKARQPLPLWAPLDETPLI